MTDVERLQRRIREGDGCSSTHVRSVPVCEVYQGRTVWDGKVEVFQLDQHPNAKVAYGWVHENDEGRKVDVVVLGIPPVNSPEEAVRAAIVAEFKRKLPAD